MEFSAFCFVDKKGIGFLCQQTRGEGVPWLYYRRGKRWLPVGGISEAELFRFQQRALPDSVARGLFGKIEDY